MVMFKRIMLVLVTALLLASTAQAAPAKDDLNARMQDLVLAGFLTAKCPMPGMIPIVAPIKRGTAAPNRSELVQRFFGGEQGVTSSESTRSPIYGKGMRLKSGKMVIMTDSGPNAQLSAKAQTQHEYVAAFMDLYNSGFAYQNNMPHAPVKATDVKITGKHSSDVKRFDVYTAAEGQRAAEQLLASFTTKLTVPSGFQTSVRTAIQDYGEKLFVYRINPECIAKVKLINPDGSKQEVQTGIPIIDSFVTIQLDGDKLLAGMEHFWDSGMSLSGTHKEAISASEAFRLAKVNLLKYFNNKPPLLEVQQVKLGYIIDRDNPNMLVPCWCFDAVFSEPETKPNSVNGMMSTNVTAAARPFAINCLTGELITLWN
jgi:hypothetical protein